MNSYLLAKQFWTNYRISPPVSSSVKVRWLYLTNTDVGNKRDNVYKVISTKTGRVHLPMLSTVFIIPQLITELFSTVD